MNLLRFSTLLASVSAFSIAFVGCAEKKTETASTEAKPPTPAAVAPKPVVASPTGPTAHVECAAPIELAPTQTLQVGDFQATSSGYKLKFNATDGDGTFIVGAVGPINDDSGQNLIALRKYIKHFRDEKVNVVVVTGDVGETAESIAHVLKELAVLKVPILTIIGNRECRTAFTDGVAMAQAEFSNVLNLNKYRVVEFPEMTFVSLPGYHNPEYINDKCASPDSACPYYKSTVEDVIRAAKEAGAPVALVSHGPPRGDNGQALDYAANNANVGDPQINRAILEGNIPFGFFSNIKEAGGKATVNASGDKLLSPDTPSKTLYLNPGPADSFGWGMNDGTTSNGMVGVFKLNHGLASYSVLRLRPASKAEQLEATKLESTGQGVTLPAQGTRSLRPPPGKRSRK